MSGDLVLYSNPLSRGRIARWMMEEVGQPYRVEMLEYGGSIKSPEFLAMKLQFGSLPERDVFKDYVARVQDREAYRRATKPDDAAMPKDGE